MKCCCKFAVIAVYCLLLGYGRHLKLAHARRNVDSVEFVLVHGASAGAWCWFKTLSGLQSSGFMATAVDLTSSGIDKTTSDRVTSLEQFAEPLTDYVRNASSKVILVGHSLGGVSISYTMEMFPEKVIKAVFVTAIMLKNNQSGGDTFPPDLFPALLAAGVFTLNFANGNTSAPTSITVPQSKRIVDDYLAGESPYELRQLALSLLGTTPYIVLFAPLQLTPERYGSVRRFYVVTGRDRILPKSYQESLIEANPVEQAFYMKESDHCPFFSFPEELTSILLYIALI